MSLLHLQPNENKWCDDRKHASDLRPIINFCCVHEAVLDKILQYHETPEDEIFVAGVIKKVRRQQRMRKMILVAAGLIGASFGAVGVMMISDSINRLITDANVLLVSIALVGLAVFAAWLFQDDVVAVG